MSSPLIPWAQGLLRKGVNTVTAPVNAFEEKFPGLAEMLGLHPQQTQQADPGMVRDANQSFRDAIERQKQEQKPMVKK